MDDVKRYRIGPAPFCMSEYDEGEWVEYEDYAYLRARLEAVEKERDEADALTKAAFSDMASNNVRLAETAHRAERADAALATAQRDGIDLAAGYMDQRHADEMTRSEKYRSGSNPWFAHVQSAKRYAEDAAAIRTLASEDKT